MREHVVPEPTGMAVLTVRMPAELIGELSRMARARGTSVSALVRAMVAERCGPQPIQLPMTAPNPQFANVVIQDGRVTWLGGVA